MYIRPPGGMLIPHYTITFHYVVIPVPLDWHIDGAWHKMAPEVET